MNLKKGGGNKLQKYDVDNGEYIGSDTYIFNENEWVKKLKKRKEKLQKEKDDLIITKFFNVGNCKINFPDIAIHDKEYCNLYIRAFFDEIKYFKFDENEINGYFINRDLNVSFFERNILSNFNRNSINFITFKRDKTIDFSIISMYKESLFLTKWNLNEGLEARFIGFNQEQKKSFLLKNKVLKINCDKQNKHIVGTKEFKEGRSLISLSIEDCNKVIEQFAGTGRFINENHEIINCGYVIGYWADASSGRLYPTTEAKIHYSNTGTHLVPLKPRFYEEEK